jgi:membrane-associated protein
MELIQQLLDYFLHVDRYLDQLTVTMGPWVYVLLFAIIFCETGLVVTPILPGDSLLFAVGALAAGEGSPLSLPVLAALLVTAAIGGDAVNYTAGYWIGPRVFKSEHSRLLNKKHLLRAQSFYEKYGGKAIVLARFMPIIRTFAPFVAGIGKMRYGQFCLYNISGGAVWVLAFLLAGYYFRESPVVKDHFHLVIVAIVVLSVLPAVIEFFLARRRRPPTVRAEPEYQAIESR